MKDQFEHEQFRPANTKTTMNIFSMLALLALYLLYQVLVFGLNMLMPVVGIIMSLWLVVQKSTRMWGAVCVACGVIGSIALIMMTPGIKSFVTNSAARYNIDPAYFFKPFNSVRMGWIGFGLGTTCILNVLLPIVVFRHVRYSRKGKNAA